MAKNSPSLLVLILGVFFAQQLLLVSAGILRDGLIDSIPEAKAIAKRHVQKFIIKTHPQHAVSHSKIQGSGGSELSQCIKSLTEVFQVIKDIKDRKSAEVENEDGYVSFAVVACWNTALKFLPATSVKGAIQTCQNRIEIISETLNTKATFQEHAKKLLEMRSQDTNKLGCIKALNAVSTEIKTAVTAVQQHQSKRFVRSLINLVEAIP